MLSMFLDLILHVNLFVFMITRKRDMHGKPRVELRPLVAVEIIADDFKLKVRGTQQIEFGRPLSVLDHPKRALLHGFTMIR